MRWLKVENFKRHVKEYREKTGKKKPQIADDLETTPATLKFWLSGARQPHIETLQRAARVFGCPVTDFIDDPGQEIAGRTVSGLSEKRRFLASMLFDSLTSNDITDEDAQILYDDFTTCLNRLRAMKAKMRN